VIFACEGKDSSTITSFCEDLQNHNGNPSNIKSVCYDMSPSYVSGILKEASKSFGNAKIRRKQNDTLKNGISGQLIAG
jgi:transposase